MKSILYVGATLMIGASIYGFVDYKSTSHKKEFTAMYEDEKKQAPVVVADTKTTVPVEKKEIASKEKKVVTKKQAVSKENEEEIVSTKHNTDDVEIATKGITTIEKPVVDIKVSKDSNAEKKVVKKKKKISTKIFSRAPIREEEDLEVRAKKEVKKD